MNTASLFDTLYLACPMCMSGASGKTLMAANTAIGLMLVILMAVLASFLTFLFYLARRARRFSDESATGAGES